MTSSLGSFSNWDNCKRVRKSISNILKWRRTKNLEGNADATALIKMVALISSIFIYSLLGNAKWIHWESACRGEMSDGAKVCQYVAASFGSKTTGTDL